MEKRLRTACSRTVLFLLALAGGLLPAQDAADRPLWPGAVFPEPTQRGLNEIEAVPVREQECPVCGYQVAVPLVDTLMRPRPGQNADGLRWRMHAASRDADQAPFPGRHKIAFQADIIVCPECGFAARAPSYARILPPAAKAWVRRTLQPNLRETQTRLLGARAAEMGERDIIDFFNRQSEIPDPVRTEHFRIIAMAGEFSKLERAEATWLAAWALRRETAGPPRGAFLAEKATAVEEALAQRKTQMAGLPGRQEGLASLQGKTRSGKERLRTGERFAARLLHAGGDIRLGRYDAALSALETMQAECRDRFLKPEQDPFWSQTSTRASRTYRLNQLETIRTEMEAEIASRVEMVARERELLGVAADLLREAIMAGECPGKDEALFHAYLVGEFLRRNGQLPLAAEWFKNTANLADADSPLAAALERQLAVLQDQAGAEVNLLSALGHDGELFIRLREMCAKR